MVEFVLFIVKTADQRLDGAVARIKRDKGAFDFRQLGDFPTALGGSGNPYDRATPDPYVGRGVFGQPGLHRFETLATDFHRLGVLPHRLDRLGVGLQYHRRHHVALVGVLVEHVVDRLVDLLLALGQVDEFLRAAVNLAALKIHDPATQCAVRRLLVGRLNRRVDIDATRIGLVAVLRKNKLANRLCHVLGVRAHGVLRGSELEWLRLGSVRLLLRDESVFFHPVDDVQLAAAGALWVLDRIVGGGRLGQACQHRGLGDAEVLQRLAKIGLAGGRKSVGAVAEEYLVHVDFQDLVLAQQVL